MWVTPRFSINLGYCSLVIVQLLDQRCRNCVCSCECNVIFLLHLGLCSLDVENFVVVGSQYMSRSFRTSYENLEKDFNIVYKLLTGEVFERDNVTNVKQFFLL